MPMSAYSRPVSGSVQSHRSLPAPAPISSSGTRLCGETPEQGKSPARPFTQDWEPVFDTGSGGAGSVAVTGGAGGLPLLPPPPPHA